MFSSFRKLLCAAALASVVLAGDVSISLPDSGTVLTAGSSVTVQIESLPSSGSGDVSLSLVIAFIGGASDPSQYLGRIGFTGTYNPQSTNAAGNLYQNVTLDAPTWFDGPGEINVANFYASGPYSAPKLQFTSSAISVIGSGG